MSRLLWENGDLELMKIFLARNGRFENRIDPRHPSTPKIHQKLLEISQELINKADGYKYIAKYKLFSILVTLIREYDYIDTGKQYAGYENTVCSIEVALNFIDNNIDKHITLAQIANKAAMSQTYFSAVFKKLNGISPWEYITIKRVEKAIELLHTSDMTKLDIAIQCGFSSSSNFYKAFQRITGKKPGDYASKYGEKLHL